MAELTFYNQQNEHINFSRASKPIFLEFFFFFFLNFWGLDILKMLIIFSRTAIKCIIKFRICSSDEKNYFRYFKWIFQRKHSRWSGKIGILEI